MYSSAFIVIASLVLQGGNQHSGDSPVVEKMKALSFLVGEWEGAGWMQFGLQARKDVKVRESIKTKLAGKALLIEGLGTAKNPETGDESTVHEALAVVTWDAKKGQYSMRAITERAGAVDPNVQVGDKSMVWSFDARAGGTVRYSIKINENGQWFEVGEFSRNGKDWNKFFEMTLTKTK